MSAVRKTMGENQKLVFVTGRKYEKYSVFGINNFSKIRTCAVLNTLSGSVISKFLEEDIAKDFPKKVMHKSTTYK